MKKASAGDWFSRFAGTSADMMGAPWAFWLAIVTVAVWGVTGPFFGYSDTWQLVINSWTNIVTFVMVFLIQHAQNRDSKAINLKLDELIRAVSPAKEELINVERLSNDELKKLEEKYERIREAVRARKGRR